MTGPVLETLSTDETRRRMTDLEEKIKPMTFDGYRRLRDAGAIPTEEEEDLDLYETYAWLIQDLPPASA
ncbi:hypothetical protein I6I10_05745 [Corynebacterium glucuronolyticum]|uniref:Uncharacterized protein n=1 Tax=Corynebacterium glucuronolyticum TaxID=39791 RepID=A0A7T4EHB2_9CORY|nr:hypothetical protein [Corynebacterium glucuronolyticum]QQB47392.1 hypothetical protein I6I10_05745 [Corynebacterium glucuronolyticum]WKD64275.1 hypothetical protein CGLUCO_10185 [Corynebacterium glucuronolyticum DSM 44120]SMB78285.1 hypothetical protein SAMN05660745_01891 [Corynebacterium glucuronolyticum]